MQGEGKRLVGVGKEGRTCLKYDILQILNYLSEVTSDLQRIAQVVPQLIYTFSNANVYSK